MNSGWAILKESPAGFDQVKSIYKSLDYKLTPNKLFRAIVPEELNRTMSDYYDLDLNVGVYMASPGWNYPFHADNTRNCAINQLLTEQRSEYVCKMLIDGMLYDIPYSTDVPCLINTAKLHNVQNNSTEHTRYLLNISINDFITFDEIKTHLARKGLVA